MVANVPATPAAVKNARQTTHNSQAPAQNKTVGVTMLNTNAPSQPDNVAHPRQQ